MLSILQHYLHSAIEENNVHILSAGIGSPALREQRAMCSVCEKCGLPVAEEQTPNLNLAFHQIFGKRVVSTSLISDTFSTMKLSYYFFPSMYLHFFDLLHIIFVFCS